MLHVHYNSNFWVVLEPKIQRAVTKIKDHMSKQEYRRIYPTGSGPRNFSGKTKKHKIPVSGTINDLPLCPCISRTGAAPYQLAKYF